MLKALTAVVAYLFTTMLQAAPAVAGDLRSQLNGEISTLETERDAKVAEMAKIREAMESEARTKLTDDEAPVWKAARARIKAIDAEIADFEARLEEVSDLYDREDRAAANARRAAADDGKRSDGKPETPRIGTITNEPRTYNPGSARQGVSFLRDLMRQNEDPAAGRRLERHQEEAKAHELRDVGTGAFTGLTVPQYLTDMVAPVRRAGRPTADICNRHPLPSDGMVVNISRITTGSLAAIQATENAGAQETNMDDTLLTVDVRTIAGMQDVSRQAIDRSTGVEDIVVADLARSYNTVLDNQILNADGTSGTHLGIRSTSGIIAVTYTDATPTAAEAWPKLWDLTQQIQAGVFLGVSHFVMHPRRFWWLVSQVGTSFPFIQVYPGVTVQAGSVEGTNTYESGPVGRLGPVPVILDANIPTNLGTNEDVILGVTADELHLWEDPNAPLFIRTDEALSNQLSVRFVLYGYSAFTAGRYPGAHGTIAGTGLILPVF